MTVICSECGGASGVTDSRPISGTVRRRRKCDVCGHKWTTFEFSRETISAMRFAIKLLNLIDSERASLLQFTSALRGLHKEDQ